MSTSIENCVKIFEWDMNFDIKKIIDIHDQYVDLLVTNFGYYLGHLKEKNIKKSVVIEKLLNRLSKKSYMRILTSPELSYRIFYKYENTSEVYDFILNSVKAELLRDGKIKENEQKVWSANGDYCYSPTSKINKNSSEYHSLKLAEIIPIDFISPLALSASVVFQKGKELYADSNGPKYKPNEIRNIYSDLLNAFEIIYVTNPGLGEIVRYFTKTLVVRKDPKSKNEFSSASAGQYTGRTLLSNAHLDFVGHDLLAESLVHEAIHSIMYMLERKTPWVKNKSLYFDSSILITSPWSGNSLRLRPYMQAVFVWYGILNFWIQVRKFNVIDEYITLHYIKSALKGFKSIDLQSQIIPWKDEIEESVFKTISVIQKKVLQLKIQ